MKKAQVMAEWRSVLGVNAMKVGGDSRSERVGKRDEEK